MVFFAIYGLETITLIRNFWSEIIFIVKNVKFVITGVSWSLFIFIDQATMAVRGSQEKFALEFLSVIIKSWGRGGGEFTNDWFREWENNLFVFNCWHDIPILIGQYRNVSNQIHKICFTFHETYLFIYTWPRNMLLIKNPQFLPNFYDTLSKWSSHELVILTKCHKNLVIIVL